MIKLDFAENIKAPVERVFQYVTDPETAAEWQDGVIESSKVHGAQLQTGTQIKTTRVLMGQHIDSMVEVTEYTPNEAYSLKSTSGPVQFSMHQTFAPDDGGTRVDTHMEIELGGIMQVAEPVVARSLRDQMQGNVKKLKEILES